MLSVYYVDLFYIFVCLFCNIIFVNLVVFWHCLNDYPPTVLSHYSSLSLAVSCIFSSAFTTFFLIVHFYVTILRLILILFFFEPDNVVIAFLSYFHHFLCSYFFLGFLYCFKSFFFSKQFLDLFTVSEGYRVICFVPRVKLRLFLEK